MTEAIQNHGFVPSETGRLLVPGERQRLNRELVMKTLGDNYPELIQDLVTEFGGLPKGHRVSVFENPDQHTYRARKDGKEIEIVSGSINLVEEHVEKDLIIIPLLLRGKKSSHHFHDYHPSGGEEYKIMKGSMIVYMDGKPVVLNEENRFVWVPLDVKHQVEAITDFAIPFIRMKNTLGIPREKLHTLVE